MKAHFDPLIPLLIEAKDNHLIDSTDFYHVLDTLDKENLLHLDTKDVLMAMNKRVACIAVTNPHVFHWLIRIRLTKNDVKATDCLSVLHIGSRTTISLCWGDSLWDVSDSGILRYRLHCHLRCRDFEFINA